MAKLLVTAGDADPHARNDNGFTAAHWAASGGHLDVCKYLHDEMGLEFAGEKAKNSEGETPLSCALSYGRSDVVDWIAKQTPEMKVDKVKMKSVGVPSGEANK